MGGEDPDTASSNNFVKSGLEVETKDRTVLEVESKKVGEVKERPQKPFFLLSLFASVNL